MKFFIHSFQLEIENVLNNTKVKNKTKQTNSKKRNKNTRYQRILDTFRDCKKICSLK